jgi:NAD(P)-dependent dehydrogenase (short-subunit alcohol dehydrogenase family)
MDTRTAIVTGASRGLGFALTTALVERGWRVVVDARDAGALAAAFPQPGASIVLVPGDVTDPEHRRALVAEAGESLALLVNNAGGLGPSPLPPLADLPIDALRDLVEVNVLAPLALVQEALPTLRANHGTVLDVTSDASVEPYEGWGGYGATKAALDHLGAVLAAEEPEVRILTVDPGDMRTQMHQDAFPGEDISDRPLPEEVVPAILALLEDDRTSGRYRAQEVVPA